jgi:ABC-2 type transport system permease protein
MLFANELLKLRTIRSPWLMLAATQLVVAVGVSGLFVQGADVDDPDTVQAALAHVGLISLFTLVLGIAAVAGEHRHQTITDTYLSTPRRGRVFAAKLGVYSAIGAVVGAMSAAVAIVATAAWLAAKGGSLDLGDAVVWQTLAGGVGWDMAFAAIGVGLGAVVRNLAGAVAAALAWIALVEGIVGQLLGDSAARWLPFRAGSALAAVSTSDSTSQLSQPAAALLLIAYIIAFALFGLAAVTRRDVA